MRSIFKLVRRFVATLMLSLLILLVLNIVLFLGMASVGLDTVGGWTAAGTVSAALAEDGRGGYVLNEEGAAELERRGAWAILIDDATGDVVWHSDNLPPEIPLHYSVSDIARGVRGYIEDYPTTSEARGEDLVILGYSKTTYWKLIHNAFDYRLIAGMPRTIIVAAAVNLLCIILIYLTATSGVLRSLRPIVSGIEALPEGESVYVREKGLLQELARAINRSSEQLAYQSRVLRRKESARANWTSGVSHDIRTPLSMVMGYAGQLAEDETLPQEARQKAQIICRQSVRMKNLVNDLNLASKLEYNMQPMKPEPVSLTTVARRAAADQINADSAGLYEISCQWETEGDPCLVMGDKGLLERAAANLLVNAQVHNPQGCRIWVRVRAEGERAVLEVEDDGRGVTPEELSRLQNAPHYMMSDGSAKEQRHGLGLLIVRQIAAAHQGEADFAHGSCGGFLARLSLPRIGSNVKGEFNCFNF